jgi:hypothetical protein
MELELARPLPNPFDVSPSANDFSLPSLEHGVDEPAAYFPKAPNFPPLCPVFRHDIAGDIPPNHSLIVRMMFLAAMSVALSLAFCVLVAFFSSSFATSPHIGSMHAGKEVFLALVHAAFGTPVIFHVQYLPFYRATRDGAQSRTAYTVQVFVVGAVTVFFIGVPGTGMVGIVYVVAAFRDGGVANQVLAGVATIWHAVNLVVEILILLLLPRKRVGSDLDGP